MALKKAEELLDFTVSFKQQPIQISDMAFRAETAVSRGVDALKATQRRWLKTESPEYEHVLFIGYKGCGKSTELNFFQQQIEEQYLVINFSVYEELDPVSLSHVELFVVMMEQLFRVAKDMEINEAYFKKIGKWLASKEIAEIIDKHLDAELSVGLDKKIGIPFLINFFGRFKAAAKASKSLKTTLKTTVEPKLQELIDLCNDLIREVRRKLYLKNKKDIVFILEDMDKVHIKAIEDIFYNYAPQLTSIQAKTIFTYPLSLYFYTRFAQIKGYFPYRIELPMVKTFDKDGSKNEKGFETMRNMIAKRANLALFDVNLDLFIEKCGGCIRDLFLMLITASENALNEDRELIIESDFKAAYTGLKKDYEAQIAEYREEILKSDGQSEIITHYPADFYKDLADLAKNPQKKPENTNRVLLLRQNLSILGYNGEGWCDVHPILKDILKDKGLI